MNARRPARIRGMTTMATSRGVGIDVVVAGFDRYLDVHDAHPPYPADVLALHREAIDMRRTFPSVRAAVRDDGFLTLVWEVLGAFGIGTRVSRIVEPREFAAELRHFEEQLARHDRVVLGDERSPWSAQRMWRLTEDIDIVGDGARGVAMTLVLHHLLPDLVVPIDWRFTAAFFGLDREDYQVSQREIFYTTWQAFERIARRVRPERLVGAGWRTSGTKLIDNAIVGYCLAEGLVS